MPQSIKKQFSGLLVLLLSSIILFGCNHTSSDPSSPATGTSPSTNPTSGNTTPSTPTPTPAPTPAPTLNSDATVSNIVISPGNLDQVVQSSQTSYTATVGFFLTSLNVTVTLSDSTASLDIDGNSVPSGTSITIPLVVGSNSVSAHVVAEDGTTSKTYTVDVTRQSLADVAQQAYVKASNAESNDGFGGGMAISGNTMVVGAPQEAGDASSTASNPNNNASNAGAAYVFVRNSGVWTQQAYLKASNAAANAGFGNSVAISGDTLVVGAFDESGDASSTASNPNTNAQGAGAAYVFVRNNGVWTQQAYLKASNAGASDRFGWNVAISGDATTVVVGAISESGDANSTASNPNDNASNAGAAYVFVRNSVVWTQQAYLKASNAEAADRFGWGVAISGNAVVVGATNEEGDANSTASNPNNNASVPGPQVYDPSTGTFVPGPNIGAGAAYVFVRNNGAWTQTGYLKASNAEANDWFGRSVAIDGNTIAVGAKEESGDASSTASNSNNNAPQAGAAYVYTLSNGAWTQQAYLKASNAGTGDYFGRSVALAGDTLVVGASREDGDTNSTVSNPNDSATDAGAAYVFTRSNGAWTQQKYLKASNVDGGDQFGYLVALSGDTVVVGAPDEAGDATSTASNPNNLASYAGAAYVFR